MGLSRSALRPLTAGTPLPQARHGRAPPDPGRTAQRVRIASTPRSGSPRAAGPPTASEASSTSTPPASPRQRGPSVFSNCGAAAGSRSPPRSLNTRRRDSPASLRASFSSRVLPMPAGPSKTTTRDRPPAVSSITVPSAASSRSRSNSAVRAPPSANTRQNSGLAARPATIALAVRRMAYSRREQADAMSIHQRRHAPDRRLVPGNVGCSRRLPGSGSGRAHGGDRRSDASSRSAR
jgi:hypothetical protein